jgi:hypothetical protein
MKSRAKATFASNRRIVPIWRTRPALLTAADRASHSSTLTPIGFSTSTCLPASIARSAIGRWNWSATATMTASTFESASIRS